jgi:hypothetical protein
MSRFGSSQTLPTLASEAVRSADMNRAVRINDHLRTNGELSPLADEARI